MGWKTLQAMTSSRCRRISFVLLLACAILMFSLKCYYSNLMGKWSWSPMYMRMFDHSTARRRPYSLSFSASPSFPFRYNKTHQEPEIRKPSSQDKIKTLLFLDPPDWYNLTTCPIGMDNCPVKCWCSINSSDLAFADVVVIDTINIKDPSPPARVPNQIRVLFGQESPVHTENRYIRNGEWRKAFNWTMTYRLDSDIPMPYDILVRQPEPDVRDFVELSMRKTHSAMWIVSHCSSSSKREEYAHALQRHYNVDIYGGCGKTCPYHSCMKVHHEKYRFYLAFENSFCVDYVTEKLFKAYQKHLHFVPIVRGGADYASFLPEGSYINTAWFDSPKQLAGYLKYLESNVTAYAEYLKAKHQFNRGGRLPALQSSWCDLCIKLHNLEKHANHYPDIVEWLENETCFTPNDF